MDHFTCSIDGCDRAKYNFRGWCNMHYQRWRKHGTTELLVKPPLGCKEVGCDRKHYAKGYCASHWKQQFRGLEVAPLSRNAIPFDTRLWARVHKTGTCWLWTGEVDDDGYGVVWDGKRTWKAHRFIQTLLVCEIPDDQELDHRCFVRNCVNPAHLRLVTRKQNIEHKRGALKNSKTGVLGVYPRGHRFGACVGHNGRSIHVGYFDTIQEADAAVRAKRAELFTHDDAEY